LPWLQIENLESIPSNFKRSKPYDAGEQRSSKSVYRNNIQATILLYSVHGIGNARIFLFFSVFDVRTQESL